MEGMTMMMRSPSHLSHAHLSPVLPSFPFLLLRQTFQVGFQEMIEDLQRLVRQDFPLPLSSESIMF